MSGGQRETDLPWREIGDHGVMVLSTCDGKHVTSRPMSVVVIDRKFYCQTDENYIKCRQIKANPHVALSLKNYSIEGKCNIIGKPYENDFFIEKMTECFPDAVARWSAFPSECVLEIEPILISAWEYEEGFRPRIVKWYYGDGIRSYEEYSEKIW